MKLFEAGLMIVTAVIAGCGGESGVRVNQRYEYYQVAGGSEQELAEEINKKGFNWDDGNVYASATTVRLSTDHETRCSSPWRCSVGSVRVNLDVLTIIPEWQPEQDPHRELRDTWNGFIDRLVLHENGHRDRAVSAAFDLLEASQALPPASSRSALEKNLEALKRESTIRLTAEELEYDRATMHGAAQGAVFP